MTPRVGILALQGDFAEHLRAFSQLDCEPVLVKKPPDVLDCQALVIPGGESTTIGKLCQRFGVDEAIIQLHQRGVPIWGTCAGMILLAKEIEDNDQWGLRLMDMAVRRNAFGRQVDSFETDLAVVGISNGPVPTVFIRAPYVTRVWGEAQVLSIFEDKIVIVRQENLLATAFHPELTDDRRIQQYFLAMV